MGHVGSMGQTRRDLACEVVDTSDYAASVTGLDAFDPSLPKNAARRAGPGRRGGRSRRLVLRLSTPGRRSPDDDPATTACAGCMRQAVGDRLAGGLVGFDVDFAYRSR